MCQTVMPRSSWLGMELNPFRPIMLLGIVVNFAPLLVMTILAGVAAQSF